MRSKSWGQPVQPVRTTTAATRPPDPMAFVSAVSTVRTARRSTFRTVMAVARQVRQGLAWQVTSARQASTREAPASPLSGSATFCPSGPRRFPPALWRPPLPSPHYFPGYRRASTNASAALRSSLLPPPVDLKYVRDQLPEVERNIAQRGVTANAARVAALYDRFCELKADTDAVRRERNEVAAKMKNVKKLTQAEREHCIARGKHLKDALARMEAELVAVEEEMHTEAGKIPNRTHPDVPVGGEERARLLRTAGEKRRFDGFAPKSHLELALELDLVNFEAAARVSGARFYYLRNAGAMLELALVNWAMQRLVLEHGFTPMLTPDLVREEMVAGCGFQPRGEASQTYLVPDGALCLVGTAEIPLGGYYADQILSEEQLPIRLAGFSHCFRREVGAAGTETRGLYRVHQFSKVEMFAITTPEQSEAMHEELRRIEESLFDALGLCYRVMDMPTEDLGNPAYRKYDIEAWMPGRGAFGEISSASNCTDYQARRLAIRYRDAQHGQARHVHTLNATACATPRLLISILESYQQRDGSVLVPPVLRPYLGGLEKIARPRAGEGVAVRSA